ncbi:MAG: carboxypeptidase M32 [Bacilli bacterium]
MEKIHSLLLKQKAYQSAITALHWDLETEAASKSKANIASSIGYLSGEAYSIFVNEEMISYIDNLDLNQLSALDQKVIKELKKDLDKIKVIPKEEFVAFQTLKANATNTWQEAKNTNNYSLFSPYLSQLIDYTKKFMAYRNEAKPLYDTILNDYEEGLNMKTLDHFFNLLKDELQASIKLVNENPLTLKKMPDHYGAGKQKKLAHDLAALVGFDFEAGVLKESEHPFTLGSDKNDVRITTHYYHHNLFSSIYSTIHEAGHAIYEQNISDEINDTIALGGGNCMSIHESQSRFYENLVGREYHFLKNIKPLIEKYFEAFKDYQVEDLYLHVNQAKSSLIRVEADELTYPFHIMIRYEVEKAIFNDNIDVALLPQLWNDLYDQYLGVRPTSDTDGILQDVHFSQALFGYFPSYALGSAYASQIYNTMQEKINVKQLIEDNDLSLIKDYLNEHIHQYGKALTSNEILIKATGKSFDPQYYIDYLKNKYQGIYQK